jgi:hypothetical protein
MTYTSLSKAELANVYTPNSPDDAPCVDGLGNPRFVSEDDFPLDDDAFYGYAIVPLTNEIDEYNYFAAEAYYSRYDDEGYYC